MTLIIAFSNFEFFFFIFRKDLCGSIPEKNLNVVFPFFFLQFQEFYLRIES